MNPNPGDIILRTKLRSGDISYLSWLHAVFYQREYQYGLGFESKVASGYGEFLERYNPIMDRIWIAEVGEEVLGSVLIMDRGQGVAQLRFFFLKPESRGIGLGGKMLMKSLDFARSCGYKSVFLWTTHELLAAAALYKKNGFELREEKETLEFGKKLIEQKYILTL